LSERRCPSVGRASWPAADLPVSLFFAALPTNPLQSPTTKKIRIPPNPLPLNHLPIFSTPTNTPSHSTPFYSLLESVSRMLLAAVQIFMKITKTSHSNRPGKNFRTVKTSLASLYENRIIEPRLHYIFIGTKNCATKPAFHSTNSLPPRTLPPTNSNFGVSLNNQVMKYFLLLLSVLASFTSAARADDSFNPKPDERFKADLLLVVAHPDDETEIGAYLARAIFDQKRRVAVVFGTRGNQGGDSAGSAQSAALGIIREIEGRQALAHFGVMNVWFLNGLDTPGQNVLASLETWNHGDSLGRLVRIIRLTRPSVIATWLPDWVAGENHGDHQAAGVIATEAFDLAGNPTAFAEQLAAPQDRFNIGNLTEGLRPWQPQKLYYFSDTAHPETIKVYGKCFV
jgi:LmbE family N-acetylglucosaminyl deacetylase